MSDISPHFRIPMAPAADPAAVVSGPQVRFTVLTSRLLRLETSPTGHFEDRASQPFWYRRQPVPEYQVTQDDNHIEIITADLHLRYETRTGPFTPDSLKITLHEDGTVWHYGDANPGNLRGTTRTLDNIDGALPLEPGLLSRAGWAIVDDSSTLVFDENCWLTIREPGGQDLYFFGYGRDYGACLRDYAALTGPVPLLPRWALGNWWSRFWPYSDAELTGLMQDFAAHEVPLSVCIVDIDWHIRQTGNESGGWTGYTWNRDLFPDPAGFIRWLHDHDLKTALNLHPADGIHPHEAQYEEMALALDVDPASQEPIPFDIARPRFTKAYFEILHHPLEAQGVDFWWMDWQQGTQSKMPGLDPLWWLNHLHFYDLGRNGRKRPFIFSRWGGLGNHRYPIGFSGDTVISWESLAYQPFFTATAANVLYGWWSHDIGGHLGGIEDPELYTRWVQYGVFSPINRLHSTANPFHERRPWGYDREVAHLTKDAMQLRHALVPYLYTMAWRCHREAAPPIAPMYHEHPEREEAYFCPNQYTFGSELIAAPYIAPADPDTRLSRQVVWLPPGDWFGFFDGQYYQGDTWTACYGGLDDIPVFARAGAIVPLGPKSGAFGVANPDHLTVNIFPGADNTFVLYEDDGETSAFNERRYALTTFVQAWQERRLAFGIEPVAGDVTQAPARRSYTLVFRGLHRPAQVALTVNGASLMPDVAYDETTDTLTVTGLSLTPADRLSLTLVADAGSLLCRRDRAAQTCLKLLKAFKAESWAKRSLYERLAELAGAEGNYNLQPLLDEWAQLEPAHLQALVEVITGAGMVHLTNTDDELLVLWNNRRSPDVRYQWYIKDHPFRSRTADGPVPRSSAINLTAVQPIKWKLKVDYAGLVSVVLGGER